VIESGVPMLKSTLDLRAFAPAVASLLLGACASTPVTWTKTDGTGADVTADLQRMPAARRGRILAHELGAALATVFLRSAIHAAVLRLDAAVLVRLPNVARARTSIRRISACTPKVIGSSV
jgi:hypothetical protein